MASTAKGHSKVRAVRPGIRHMSAARGGQGRAQFFLRVHGWHVGQPAINLAQQREISAWKGSARLGQ